jgi:hypothetical protein
LEAFDPVCWPVRACSDLVDVLARATKACEVATARAAARAGMDATAVARAGGCTTGAARAALTTLQAAEPETLRALAGGEVSLTQAAHVVSAPGHEAELLGVARSSGLGALKDAARKHRLAAIDPEELHARQHAARRARHWRTDLGLVHLEAELPPEVGVPLVNRLDTETDRAWRAATKGGRSVARDAIAAEAFVSIFGDRGNCKATSADVVIVVDLNGYRRGHTHDGELCHIVGGGPIPVRVAREMAQDAFLKAVLHDGIAIHTVAHFGRHIPAVLRTALELGAPPDLNGVTCSKDGCDRRHRLQWHHIRSRASGGPTSHQNLAPICVPDHVEETERQRKAGELKRARPP